MAPLVQGGSIQEARISAPAPEQLENLESSVAAKLEDLSKQLEDLKRKELSQVEE